MLNKQLVNYVALHTFGSQLLKKRFLVIIVLTILSITEGSRIKSAYALPIDRLNTSIELTDEEVEYLNRVIKGESQNLQPRNRSNNPRNILAKPPTLQAENLYVSKNSNWLDSQYSAEKTPSSVTSVISPLTTPFALNSARNSEISLPPSFAPTGNRNNIVASSNSSMPTPINSWEHTAPIWSSRQISPIEAKFIQRMSEKVSVATVKSPSNFSQSDLPKTTEANSYLNTSRDTYKAQALMNDSPGDFSSRRILSEPELRFQGVYLLQGDKSSARARVTGFYPISPNTAFGGTVDLTDGLAFADSRTEGLQINELYLALSLPDAPQLRFLIGQLDLTSYFDRNSFAKDGATHFFNSIFQTNSALAASGISSRQGILANWSVIDNIEFKVAGFSSARTLSDFRLDAWAGEVGIRYGNAIIRGTYVTDRDAGINDGFQEIFQFDRGSQNGLLPEDREEAFGVNLEVFIPNANVGLFTRYGRYNNLDLGRGGDTYNVGLNVLDLFAPSDRFGIAYGRALSNDELRRQEGSLRPDAFEVLYDFQFLSNLRLGFNVQALDEFSEIILGFRIKTEFDMIPFR